MLRPEQLDAALQRQGSVLIAGDEALLVEEGADRARAALRQRGHTQREVLRVDRGFDWPALQGECASGSLFADKRLIELRFDHGPDARAGAALVELASQSGDDIAVLAIGGSLDSAARKSKWFRQLDEALPVVYFWKLRHDDYPGWLRQRLQAAGLQGDAAVIDAILHSSEGNLLAAAQLLRQLQALHGGPGDDRRLTAEAVLALGADMARFDPFSLMDRVFAGDAAAALRAVRSLRQGHELPAVTGGLAYVLRQWHGAQVQFARSGDATAAARSVGVFAPRAQLLGRALQRGRPALVQGLMRWLADIDSAAKRGQASAAWDDLITWTAVASGAVRADFLPRALCPSLP